MLQNPINAFYEDFMYAYSHWLDAVASEPEGEFSIEALDWAALITKRCKLAVQKHLIPPWFILRRIIRGVESETFISPDSTFYWKYLKQYLESILIEF